MPLIIPPLFVFVFRAKNYRTVALVWSCASSFCVVRRASLLGNVWQAPIYFYCFVLAARKQALVFYFCFFFIPLSSIMYDSSDGATQSTRAAPFLLLNIKLEYIIKPRRHRAWTRGRIWDLGCRSEGKVGWGWGGWLIRRRDCQRPVFCQWALLTGKGQLCRTGLFSTPHHISGPAEWCQGNTSGWQRWILYTDGEQG